VSPGPRWTRSGPNDISEFDIIPNRERCRSWLSWRAIGGWCASRASGLGPLLERRGEEVRSLGRPRPGGPNKLVNITSIIRLKRNSQEKGLWKTRQGFWSAWPCSLDCVACRSLGARRTRSGPSASSEFASISNCGRCRSCNVPEAARTGRRLGPDRMPPSEFGSIPDRERVASQARGPEPAEAAGKRRFGEPAPVSGVPAAVSRSGAN